MSKDFPKDKPFNAEATSARAPNDSDRKESHPWVKVNSLSEGWSNDASQLKRLGIRTDEPFISKATYTHGPNDSDREENFEYVKIPHHLIPRGWSNDASQLEKYVKLGFNKTFSARPETCIPILHYKDWRGFLAMDDLVDMSLF